jgi:putative FmdB family regulatory protein
MPIYSYSCAECGHAQDHLMKMGADAPPCPACGKDSYAKQLTAAAFALKGDGYYATDFKDKPKAAAPSTAKPAGGCAGACPCHP